MSTVLAALAGLGLVCGTAVVVRWIDRCDCRFANETGDES